MFASDRIQLGLAPLRAGEDWGSLANEVRGSEPNLICRVASRLCALSLKHVAETMRPLPVEAVAGMPQFVLGIAVIRGSPVPVVDGVRLLVAAGEPSKATRFVVIRVGERRVALAVGSVLGIRSLEAASLGGLPPLLGDANADVVAALGTLDSDLLLVLEGSRMLPASAWAALAADEARV